VFPVLFFPSVAGALPSGFTGVLEQADADVLVYDEASARNNPTVSVLPPDAVVSVGGVQAAAPVSQTFATVESDGEQQDGVLVGIDPGTPGTPVSLDEGRLPDGPGEALASGSGLAPGFDFGACVSVDGGDGLEVLGIAAEATFDVTATLYLPNASDVPIFRAPSVPEQFAHDPGSLVGA
jgi:hypothetical protein